MISPVLTETLCEFNISLKIILAHRWFYSGKSLHIVFIAHSRLSQFSVWDIVHRDGLPLWITRTTRSIETIRHNFVLRGILAFPDRHEKCFFGHSLDIRSRVHISHFSQFDEFLFCDIIWNTLNLEFEHQGS